MMEIVSLMGIGTAIVAGVNTIIIGIAAGTAIFVTTMTTTASTTRLRRH